MHQEENKESSFKSTPERKVYCNGGLAGTTEIALVMRESRLGPLLSALPTPLLNHTGNKNSILSDE